MATSKDNAESLSKKSVDLSKQAVPARYRLEQASKKASMSAFPAEHEQYWKARSALGTIENKRDNANKDSSALRYAALQRKMGK